MDHGHVQAKRLLEVDFFGKHRAALDSALGQVSRRPSRRPGPAQNLLAGNVMCALLPRLARIDAQLAQWPSAPWLQREQQRPVHDQVQAGLDTALELRQMKAPFQEAAVAVRSPARTARLTQNAPGGTASPSQYTGSPRKIDLFAKNLSNTPTPLAWTMLVQRASVSSSQARAGGPSGEVDG